MTTPVHDEKSGHESGDEEDGALNSSEQREVVRRRSGSAKVIHEVIRREGKDELDRPWSGLMFSGLVAGVAISASPINQAIIRSELPSDAPWAHMVAAFGYTTGFIMVIMGSMQLFTESTVTAVLPVATKPSLIGLAKMLRLWAIVFLSNLVGTLAIAGLIATQWIMKPDAYAALVELSSTMAANGFWGLLILGVPAGLLIATAAWILPNAKGSEFWVIVVLTWLIALAELAHCVAGSFEAWTLWLHGDVSFLTAVFGIILPALIGNIIGGTGLFAFLAHGQVREELTNGGGGAEGN